VSSDALGAVAAIWRHPVKSLRGERLEWTQVGEHGLPDDRAFGIVERTTGKVLSAKRIGRLLEANASSSDGGLVIELADGTRVEGTGPEVDATLSVWLGRDVSLVRAGGPSPLAYDFGAGYDGPARIRPAFVDSSPVHVVTTASLHAGARAAGAAAPWDPRRFRPNLVIDTGADTGFLEDRWAGHVVEVGDVTLSVIEPTERCVMTTRPQADLAEDRTVLRTLASAHGSDLGVYATVVTPGAIAVGNPVRIRASSR
jgi:uncharacterized protein YcbX